MQVGFYYEDIWQHRNRVKRRRSIGTYKLIDVEPRDKRFMPPRPALNEPSMAQHKAERQSRGCCVKPLI
jgi:hypothetical protein